MIFRKTDRRTVSLNLPKEAEAVRSINNRRQRPDGKFLDPNYILRLMNFIHWTRKLYKVHMADETGSETWNSQISLGTSRPAHPARSARSTHRRRSSRSFRNNISIILFTSRHKFHVFFFYSLENHRLINSARSGRRQISRENTTTVFQNHKSTIHH